MDLMLRGLRIFQNPHDATNTVTVALECRRDERHPPTSVDGCRDHGQGRHAERPGVHAQDGPLAGDVVHDVYM